MSHKLAVLEQALEHARPLDDLSRHLTNAAGAATAWTRINTVQEKREQIKEALEPLKALKQLVAVETSSSIARLSGTINDICQRICLKERLAYEEAIVDKKEVGISGSFSPGMRIDAALVANASWMRAILWSFLFALREETLKATGFNPLPLLVLETEINRRIETPISQSDTWTKIATGNTHELDQSDRAILYVLIRHLQFRTPHAAATFAELAEMAADSNSTIPFTDEERSMYAVLRANPDIKKQLENFMAATTEWTEGLFKGSLLEIMRSPIDLRSSTTPAFPIPAPWHQAMHLPVPGMSPHKLALTLNPRTIACLTLGDFDGGFSNCEIDEQTSLGFNHLVVGEFAHFDYVRHLVSRRDGLIGDMTWAPYDLVKDTPQKITFRRRAPSN